jgi:CubicO group peptidase (beta-lactamase class C family)
MNPLRLLLACALLLPGPSLLAVDPPATPAGRQLGHWLAAFNSGDKAQLEELLARYRNREGRTAERSLEFFRRTGGFDLVKVEESAPTRLTALVKERKSDQVARLDLEVEPQPPNLITKLGVEAIEAPPALEVRRLTEAQALEAARARVAELAKDGRFSGAVLVARNGKVVLGEAVGLADREANAPNRLDTRFNLGSMNKMFTAVAVAQLAQQGKLRLNDPLGTFFPGYPNAEVANVTLEQLLTHTGGTGDIFGPEFDAHRNELKEPKDYIALYGRRGVLFPPGTKFHYSNYGFVLLGAVVEKVSGQGYYDYVRDHVYKPAGMTGSGSFFKTGKTPNLAVGYTSEDSPAPVNNFDTLPVRGSPAGGGYSTVEDLLRFATALREHKLLNEEYTNLVTTGRAAMGGSGRYAMGFGDFTVNGVRFYGHNGGAPGINSELRIYPASGYVVAVMANLDPPAASALAGFIGARLPAK